MMVARKDHQRSAECLVLYVRMYWLTSREGENYTPICEAPGGVQESFMGELAKEKSLPLATSSFIVLPGDSAGSGTGKGIHLNSVFDGVAKTVEK
jgi:hypothetical protein